MAYNLFIAEHMIAFTTSTKVWRRCFTKHNLKITQNLPLIPLLLYPSLPRLSLFVNTYFAMSILLQILLDNINFGSSSRQTRTDSQNKMAAKSMTCDVTNYWPIKKGYLLIFIYFYPAKRPKNGWNVWVLVFSAK